MLASKRTRRGVVGAIVLATVLAVSGYALTNILDVADVSNAGDGVGTIADVAVVDDTIDYTLNATNPALADQVVFDLTTTDAFLAGTEVFVQLVDVPASGGSTADEWFSCVLAAGTATCDLTGGTTPVAIEDIDQFRVVVAD